MRRNSVAAGGFLASMMAPDWARFGGPRGSLWSRSGTLSWRSDTVRDGVLPVAELGAVQVRVHGLAHRVRNGVHPGVGRGCCGGLVVDILVKRSDKLQQFTFDVGSLQKTAKFSQAQFRGLFVHNAWSDSGYMFSVSPGCFWPCSCIFLREGDLVS